MDIKGNKIESSMFDLKQINLSTEDARPPINVTRVVPSEKLFSTKNKIYSYRVL